MMIAFLSCEMNDFLLYKRMTEAAAVRTLSRHKYQKAMAEVRSRVHSVKFENERLVVVLHETSQTRLQILLCFDAVLS